MDTQGFTPPAPGAEWEHVNSLQRKLLGFPDGSTLTNQAYTPDAADDLTNKDAHHRQYSTDPLIAQTIAGNVKAQLQCLEANAGNNLFLTMKVYVMIDGSTIRGTLLAITRATSLEVATALTNRTFPSTALSSVAASENDRLVVEIGLGGTPTAAGGVQGHNGTLRWGCAASSGDLLENETETALTYRGWIEFSQDILFIDDIMPQLPQSQPFMDRRGAVAY